MIYAINSKGTKIKATPKAKAVCPSCSGDLIPKCGKINIWHWAHKAKDCDSWHEPESEWHLNWKSHAKPEHVEVVRGPHRADILGPRGVVVELQNNSISPKIIKEREDFYGKMVWIVNAEPFFERLSFHQFFYRGKLEESFFFWDHPRKSWFCTKKPVFFDVGCGDISISTLYRIWSFESSSHKHIILSGNDYLIWVKKFDEDFFFL